VIAGFLLFAGLGSACTARLQDEAPDGAAPLLRRRPGVAVAAGVVAGLALLYLFVLPPLFERLIILAEPARIAVSLALIAPLAFFMGMPFPLGLSRLSNASPRLVPWAWGVNGCASVLGAVLAQVLAVHFGFTAVILAAVLAYLVAASAFARRITPDLP
jgi:hypothetical protein